MEKRRILTTSIPSWSDLSGADTISNLMDGYGEENVANLYIRGDSPTSKAAGRYARINEGAVMKSVLFRNTRTFTETPRTEVSHATTDKAEKERYRFFTKYRLSVFLFLRELAWKLGKWKSKELDAFLEELQPEIVFFPIESYVYFNRINSYILKKTGAKAVGFLWDDNFTYRSVHSPGEKLMRMFTRRSVKKLVRRCDAVLAINPMMKEECDAFFGIDSVLVTKGIDCSLLPTVEPKPTTLPIRCHYAGNLYIDRDKTLQLLARTMAECNRETECFSLDIYTNSYLSDAQKEAFRVPGCRLMGGVPQSELKAIQQEADVLVFAEALSGRHSKAARLSFSTKITDYLAAGKAILALAPEDIAPMRYFSENQAAFCASNQAEMKAVLKQMAEHPGCLSAMAKTATELGRKNHDMKEIRNRLWLLLEQLGTEA